MEFRELLLQLNRERQTTILISSHILSELSNLATCYGFIEQGHLIEEISGTALQEKCRECLELSVDDASQAALTLEQALGTRDYEILPHTKVRVYTLLDQPQKVNSALMNAGVSVYSFERKGSNLEDYFLKLIGGRHHG